MIGALLRKFLGSEDGPDMGPLYTALVATARQPHWYVDGGVEDSVNGRFEMVIAILSVLLARIESEGEAGQVPSVRLTEKFVDDMDGQMREAGIGDVVVGKHMGKLMGALGGRISAYRAGLSPDGDLGSALERNLYRGEPVDAAKRAHSDAALRALAARIGDVALDDLIIGKGLAA